MSWKVLLGLTVLVGFGSGPEAFGAPGTAVAAAQPSAVTAAPAAVQVVQAPAGCFVPDAVVDVKGVLHVVYALDGNAWYERSTDNGKSFSKPVRVNSEGRVEFKMGERGPKLAVGADGVIHVVWGDLWSKGVDCFPRYARSLDGGKSFEPRQSLSAKPGVDGLTMTADGKGHVVAFWHAAHPPQTAVPAATWLFLVRSKDNGASFSASERIKIDNLSELACTCCMMRARLAADGNVCLAFRTAVDNIRDFYVLKSAVDQNKFTAARVNTDGWRIDYCPMCGPELSVGPDGRQTCAFMSRNKVYWAMSDAKGAGFELHVGTPDSKEGEIYPTAVANRKGEVLLVWQEGPMSTTGTATVKWAIYSAAGKFSGRRGELGTTTSGTKATAFVGSDDGFRILTTAQPSSRNPG